MVKRYVWILAAALMVFIPLTASASAQAPEAAAAEPMEISFLMEIRSGEETT